MKKVALEIIGITYSTSQTRAFILILGEKDSNRHLPIVIGSAEAQSISLAIEGHKANRPLTHDLFVNTALAFDINLIEVVINRFHEGVYHAILTCEQHGEIKLIDARPSDAIALALRFGSEIYAYTSVMDEAGIIMDSEDEEEQDDENTQENTLSDAGTKDDSLSQLSHAELKARLQSAIDNEDYAKAASIRDEIKNRS